MHTKTEPAGNPLRENGLSVLGDDAIVCLSPRPVRTPLCRLVVDKFAFRVDRKYLNIPVVEQLICETEASVGMLRLGGNFIAYIKPPLQASRQPLYRQIILGLQYLRGRNAFSTELSEMVEYAQAHLDDHLLAIGCLAKYFVFFELELAMDFCDLPLYRKAVSAHESPRGFIWVGSSRYSALDYDDGKRGGRAPNGSKGVQHSAVKMYNWTLKHGGRKKIWRLEFRLSGKYRRHFRWDWLLCNVPALAEEMLPLLGGLLNKLIVREALTFYGHWLLPGVIPWWFKELLKSAGWHNNVGC